MVYNTKFVVAVKVGGKVLRETSNGVTIPFGSEYSILLKNLNTVKALVTVYIDGQDAGDGTQFVVEPNSSVELERYIRNGNLSRGNRFKFIERTEEIEDARGIKADDGLVRVEYKFEKPSFSNWPTYHWNSLGGYQNTPLQYNFTQSANLMRSRSLRSTSMYGAPSAGSPAIGAQGSAPQAMMQCSSTAMNYAENCSGTSFTNDAGITVAGSESNQQFRDASWFQTESESHVIVLQLRGIVGGRVAKRPVTVTVKSTCTTCYKINSPWDKFCSRCGTALNLI